MSIDVVLNGRAARVLLLRAGCREGKRTRRRTIANLGPLLPAMIGDRRVSLAGSSVAARPEGRVRPTTAKAEAT